MSRIFAVAVVGFVLVLAGGAAAGGDGATVSISNQSYAPIVATVNPGGTVTWVNDDQETHSVFIEAVGADHLLAPGATYSYTFGDAGEFTYHCTLHSHAGKVVVAAAVVTTAQPPPTAPSPTTVAPTLAPTTVATSVATSVTTVVPAAPSTTAAPVTTASTLATTLPATTVGADSTVAPVAAVKVGGGGGGGLPAAALIGGGGGGAALGVGAGFVIKRRFGRRAAPGA